MHAGTLIFDGFKFELMDSMAPFSMVIKVTAATPDAASHQFYVIAESATVPIESPATRRSFRTLKYPDARRWTSFSSQAVLAPLQRLPVKLSSVCTGSSLLANAGFLSGRRATSNKGMFDEQATYGSNINGVSAGIDAGYTVSKLIFGEEATEKIFKQVRYEPLSENVDPYTSVHPRKLHCLQCICIRKSKSFALSCTNKLRSITTILFKSFDFLDVATVSEMLLGACMTHYINLCSCTQEVLRTPEAGLVFEALEGLECPVIVSGKHAINWIAEEARLSIVDLSEKGFKKAGK
ncbi:hypothetical protein BJ742DRAFT_872144 [Cladochytrium replicatum]|nr:hypothetical protein BJ742DRAFT_872144 [Cladochytrium replicatum]